MTFSVGRLEFVEDENGDEHSQAHDDFVDVVAPSHSNNYNYYQRLNQAYYSRSVQLKLYVACSLLPSRSLHSTACGEE